MDSSHQISHRLGDGEGRAPSCSRTTSSTASGVHRKGGMEADEKIEELAAAVERFLRVREESHMTNATFTYRR